MTAPDREALALEDAWLRRMARALVSDPHLAEDLAQDAWVTSLQEGRAGRGARAWLGGVLRHRTMSHFRSRAARADQERRASRPEAVPPVDEVLAELQLRERVAHELAQLDEPYRTALYLRFVAGHTLRETARRMRVAPSTATERIQGGLARLRRRLDRAHGGDRQAWLALILPWSRTSALLGTSSFVTIAMFTLTPIALFALGWLVRPAVPIAPTPPIGGLTHAPTAVTEAALEPSLPSSRLRAEASTAHTAPPLSSRLLGRASARISGEFTGPDHQPPLGAAWTLEGRIANQQLADDHGVPAAWVDPSGVLDASGRLDVAFAAHPAFQYTLTVRSAGLVSASWRWGALGAEEQVELGEHTLRAAGRVEGRVVDSEGNPLGSRTWHVYGRESEPLPALGLQPAEVGPVSSSADASFVLDGLPGGAVDLRIHDPILGWITGPVVDVVPGTTVHADIVVAGLGEHADRIVVQPRMRPFTGFPPPSPLHVWLVDGSGARRSARMGQFGFVFDDVGPGTFRVEVDDPRLAGWSADGITRGARIAAELCGSAAVEFRVTGPGGEAIAGYTLDALMNGVPFSPSRFRAATATTPLPEGTLSGLVPGSYTFALDSAEGAAVVTVPDLGVGERRVVSVALDPACVVRGRVLHPDGSPAAGRLVRLVVPAPVGDSPASPILDGDLLAPGMEDIGRRHVSRTVTDSTGSFRLALGPDPRHLVVVGRNSEPQVECALLESGPGAAPGELALVVPRGATLNVHVEVPPGMSSAGWALVFARSGATGPGVPATSTTFAEHDGRFAFGPIVGGPGRLVLVTELAALRDGALPTDGHVLAELEIADGEARVERFGYPGPAPITLVFDVSASTGTGTGTSADARVSVAVLSAQGERIARANGPSSGVGPVTLPEGTYTTWFAGADWIMRSTTHFGAGSHGSVLALDLGLTARRVRLVDEAGAPYRNLPLLLRGQPGGLDGPAWTTDGEGWVDLRIGAGSYDLEFDGLDPTLVFRSASLVWPLAEGVETVVVR